MSIRKCVIAIVMAMVLIFSMILPVFASTTNGSFAPLNPEFVKYMQKVKMGDFNGKGLHRFGYIPSPVNLSHLRGQSVFGDKAKKAQYPATYDLRDYNKVTSVKNQDPYGTCWAFAANGSIESCLMPLLPNPDYSEWHLAYFAYTGDDSFTLESGVTPFDQGGDDFMAVAVLARWTGSVNESDCPYDGPNPTGDEPVQKHLQNALYMISRGSNKAITPLELANEDIKYAVTNYGALSIGMYWDDEDESCWNESNSAYYYSGSEESNHAVLLVGWDDDYSADNFTNTPPGDGAWIIKNSWGADWGDEGYFYISYYDTSLDSGVAFISESATNYSSIYDYDPLGWCEQFGYSATTAWMSNVFTAGTPSDTGASATESLKAVSFYTTSASTGYEIYIYTDVSGGPRSGTLALGPQIGTLDAPGYHTVVLSSAVSVTTGNKFSVVVKLTTPGYNFPIPVERAVADYSDKARANQGESYLSPDGTTWTDATGIDSTMNVCIKAFTGGSGGPTPTPTPTGTVTPTPTHSVSATPTPTGTSKSGGGGGCNAFGGVGLLMLIVPGLYVILRK